MKMGDTMIQFLIDYDEVFGVIAFVGALCVVVMGLIGG